jgi:hypothetical protein
MRAEESFIRATLRWFKMLPVDEQTRWTLGAQQHADSLVGEVDNGGSNGIDELSASSGGASVGPSDSSSIDAIGGGSERGSASGVGGGETFQLVTTQGGGLFDFGSDRARVDEEDGNEAEGSKTKKARLE